MEQFTRTCVLPSLYDLILPFSLPVLLLLTVPMVQNFRNGKPIHNNSVMTIPPGRAKA